MKKLLLILILLLSFTLIGNCAWLGSAGEWDYRIELAINDYVGDIGDPVTWFPCTIFLKDANGDSTKIFEEIGNNYRKMAITQSDGVTELKGEIEGWNYDAGTPALSTGFIHTSADGWTIDGNTSIWVYYDNDHDDNDNIDVTNTAPAEEVWDGNSMAVQHLSGATYSDLDDSTSNNNDITAENGTPVYNSVGKIGNAVYFARASDEYISMSDSASLDIGTSDITISAWVNITSGASDGYLTIVDKREGGSPYKGYTLFFPVTEDTERLSFQVNDTTTSDKHVQIDFDIRDDTWHHIMVSVDRNSVTGGKFYVDGIQKGSDQDYTASQGSIANALVATIGVNVFRNSFVDGTIDEIQISSTVRSAAWAKGSYNSGYDTLFNYGSEETEVPVVGITWNGVVISKWNGVAITIPINTQ